MPNTETASSELNPFAAQAKRYNRAPREDAGLLMCPVCGEVAVIECLDALGDVDLTDVLGPDEEKWPIARVVWRCQACRCVWDLEGKPTWRISDPDFPADLPDSW